MRVDSGRLQVVDRVLSLVLRAEIFPVFLPVEDLESHVRVDAAAVVRGPFGVLVR